MKIETTGMDDVWIGIMTLAILYLVMRTIKTLERISKKVDSMVDHIGAEVDSAIVRLSKEATGIIQNLEKNAFGYKENLIQHVQGVELQCYWSRNGIAFAFGPKSLKRKSASFNNHLSSGSDCSAVQKKKSSSAPVVDPSFQGSTQQQQQQQNPHHHGQLVALHKCIDKILKCKYKLPFTHRKHKSSVKNNTNNNTSTQSCSQEASSNSTTTTADNPSENHGAPLLVAAT